MKLWRLLFVVLALCGVGFAWRSEFNHDEIEHLHAAWLLSVGQRPYRDFLEQHHPTLWILFRPLVRQLSSPRWLIFAARLYDLALLSLLAWTLHQLVRRLFPDARPWAVLLVLGSYIFSHNMLLFRPDPTMNLLLYLGLLQWALFLDQQRLSRAALAGFCFGLAAAVLQKAFAVEALVALSVLALLFVQRDAARRRRLLLGGATALGAALLPLGALGAWILTQGIWRDFWFWNYDFNRFFYTRATLSMHFSAAPGLARSVVEDLALWGFALVGVWSWLRRPRSWDSRDQLRFTLLTLLVGYLILLSFNRFPFEQYFIVFLPLLAPFAAEVFTLGPRPVALGARVACAAMLLVMLGQFLDLADSSAQRRVQDQLLSHTAPYAKIYASPPHHPVFRRDGSYFWYNGALIGDALAEYDRLHPGVVDKRILDDAAWPPEEVFLDPRFPSYWPWRWAERGAAFHAGGEANIWSR